MHCFLSSLVIIFGGNLLEQEQYGEGGFSSGVIVKGAIFLGGNYPWGQLSGGQKSKGQFSSRVITLEPFITMLPLKSVALPFKSVVLSYCSNEIV